MSTLHHVQSPPGRAMKSLKDIRSAAPIVGNSLAEKAPDLISLRLDRIEQKLDAILNLLMVKPSAPPLPTAPMSQYPRVQFPMD